MGTYSFRYGCLDIDPALPLYHTPHTALGLALGAKPAIKKTHAMSMLATDQPGETNSAARKRLRGARAAPPAVDGAPPLETSSARGGKKQRPPNPDYDDAYRNLLERTQGQARSQAFHRQDAQKRRAQGKTRDGLIAPPTFVNMGGAPAVAAAALAGAPTSSVGEFVQSLCAGLEDGQGEEEAGQKKEEEGRTRRSGPGGKEDMDDDEAVASGPKKHNPFAALGSDDEGDEEAESPAVIFQPSVLRPPPLGSMAALSSSLLDVDTLQQPHHRENDDSSASTTSKKLPPLPIFVPLPVTVTDPVVGEKAVGEVSTDAKKEQADFEDL